MDKIINQSSNERFFTEIPPNLDEDEEDRGPAVLPADHPLLEKFQQALKTHLLKANADVENELLEVDHSVHLLTVEREECGAKLYDIQQEIERQNQIIDDYRQQMSTVTEKRLKHEANVALVKQDLDARTQNYKDSKRLHNERLLELSNIQILEQNVNKWTEEINAEAELAKGLVNKEQKAKILLAEQKRQVDLLLFNLDNECRKRERELNNINEQIKQKSSDMETLNGSLADANSDLEVIKSEQKRLITAWTDVIVAIQKRDKILMGVKSELDKEHERQKLLQADIDGTKKEANKEMEQNEKLEAFKIRLIHDVDGLKAHIDRQRLELEKIYDKLDKTNALLEQCESDQQKATVEGHLINNDLKDLMRSLEKQTQRKLELEEEILELLQNQITADQASQNNSRKLRDAQDNRRHMEVTMFNTEQQLSRALLDLELFKNKVMKGKEDLAKLLQEKDDVERKGNALEKEIHDLHNAIGLKMRQMDAANKTLQELLFKSGCQELDVNRMKIIELESQVSDMEKEILKDQGYWIRIQSEVVALSEKRARQLASIQMNSQKIMVIEQKTLKIDNELEKINKFEQESVRQLKQLTTNLEILGSKGYEWRKTHEIEQNEASDAERTITNKMRDAEMSIVNLEAELKNMKQEIDDIKTRVIEKHREALSWETKWKFVEKTISFRQKKTGDESDIAAMKAEIHRMEVRWQQLTRAQEKLSHDLEICVMHRANIYHDARVRDKLHEFKNTKRQFTIKHKLNELKNKLKQANNDLMITERSMKSLDDERDRIEREVVQINRDIEQERVQNSMLQNEIEMASLQKQANLEQIVRIQRRVKRYRLLAGLLHLPKCRSDTIITAEYERNKEINNQLREVLEALLVELPDHKCSTERVLQTLNLNLFRY